MPRRTLRKILKMKTTFTHVVAVSTNGIIGAGKGLPWYLPEDLRMFKKLTMGKTVIVGHNTFNSILNGLPGRDCLVISNHIDLHYKTYSMNAAIEHAMNQHDEVFIIGGATIYEQTWPIVDKIIMSVIGMDVAGDVRYDCDHLSEFRMIKEEKISEIIKVQTWVRK